MQLNVTLKQLIEAEVIGIKEIEITGTLTEAESTE